MKQEIYKAFKMKEERLYKITEDDQTYSSEGTYSSDEEE
jgi:hypothetical protein